MNHPVIHQASSRTSSNRGSPKSGCAPLHRPLVNLQTEKMVLKKFSKEFVAAVQRVMMLKKLDENGEPEVESNEASPDAIPLKIDCYRFVMLLAELGAIRSSDIENKNSQEYKRVEDMWLALVKTARHPLHGEQDYDDKVFIGDAKIMIMASFGVKGNRRMEADDNGAIKEQQQKYPKNLLHFGWLAKPIDPDTGE